MWPSQKPCTAATGLSLHTQINFCAVDSSCGSSVGDSFAEIAVGTLTRGTVLRGDDHGACSEWCKPA